MTQMRSVAAILISTTIFLMGNGLLGTLIPVRAHLEGFSGYAIGLIGSAYFIGFVFGCYAFPRLLARVGHSRSFAVAAGIAATSTLLMSLMVDQLAWVLMRAAFGMAAAGLYMVIESWLNDRATPDTRGLIFSYYLFVNFSGLVIGQSLFVAAKPTGFALFAMCAIFYSICLIPVGLTRTPQPAAAGVAKLSPLKLFRASPVGVAGCIAVGFANGALWTFAPVYAESIGMHRGLLAAFMSAFTLGGALVQVPIGRFSDRLDRRRIIVGITAAAALVGVMLYFFGGISHALTLSLIVLFGIVVLPLYGLSIAHANDRLPRTMFVEASATLLMINAVASVFGPMVASFVTVHEGMASLFLYTAVVHASMSLYTLFRITRFAPPQNETREPFEPLPQAASPNALNLDPRRIDVIAEPDHST